LEKLGVQDIPDFLNMEDEQRLQVLHDLSSQQIVQIANICNRFPSISLSYKVNNAEEIVESEEFLLSVDLEREGEEFNDFVNAPYYPKVLSLEFTLINQEKQELWWLLVGEKETN